MSEGITVRLADARDAERLFEWHNDPITVAGSRSKAGSEWYGHKDWLEKQLANQGTSVLLIGLFNNEPCGLVWFKRNKANVWETSLNLAAWARGKGVSVPMLASAMNWLREHRSAVHFSTEVGLDNPVAQRAYEKCGFLAVHPSPGFMTMYSGVGTEAR